MPSGVANLFMLVDLLEVSPHKTGKIAGELMYKHASNYSKNQSLDNLMTLNKKASQVDRIKDMFSKRKIGVQGHNGKNLGRDLGAAFDEHKKLAMSRMKYKNYKEPKAKKPLPHKRLKNAWSRLDRQEKLLIGMLGGSVAASAAIGAADVYADSKKHKKEKKK